MNRKKKRSFVLIILILFTFGGGISFYQHTINVQAKEDQKEVENALTLAKKTTNLLYLTDKTELLSDSITQEKIQEAEHSLKILSALTLNETQQKYLNNLSQQVNDATQMFTIQSSIHKKFKDEKIISHDVEFSKEDKDLMLLKKRKPLFVKKISEIIEQSKRQLAIKQELSHFFKDYDKLEAKETIARSDFNSFKEKVDSLPSETFKSSLTEALVAVQKAIEKRAVKEREVKEEEAKIEKEREEAEKEHEIEAEKTKETDKDKVAFNDSSVSTSVSKETTQSQTSSKSIASSKQVVPAQQTGIEGLIARSLTSQYTDQIIGVVANGSSSTVYVFEKNGAQWQTILSVPGRVGYNGVGSSYEGSGRTPKGAYSLGFAFGTGPNPGTILTYKQITGNSYWISNPDDSQYNTWQERSSSSSLDEHMNDYQTQYKYGITLNYNNGVNGGSAFFVHVNGNGATAGCISVSESNMLYLMQHIRNGAYIINVTSESELAHY
ncbi:L,D-transpeptidase family protein [Carnobacterium funditum]|uniref:L,D-transpeptidase family protein n=1 Tax=Carnobacterium funditum TaxID=2752 RepID=UPI0006917C8B|nr:L,D-transpeptidase family protein [Carnobacterium funditum]